jgi:hypothetical protein
MAMGLSLGNVVSVFTDPGSLVKDAVNSLLPKEMAVVGSIAGAVVDFQTGRPFQGAQHAFQALKDLPQALNAGNANTTRSGSPEFEPSPPPLRPSGPSWRGTAAQLPNAANTVETPKPPSSGLSGFISMLEKALTLLKSALGGQNEPASAATKPKTDTATEKSDSSTKSSSTKPKDDDESSTSSTKSSSSKSSSSSTKKSDTTTMAKLNKMSDGEFMQEVIKGKIPDEILSDPKAMMQIQTRLNHISEMTRLMSSMMQALHDIQMNVIQNVRA